jgi:hypothetical protein
MNQRGTSRISNCLNSLPQDVLGCPPSKILIIFFCKKNLPAVGRDTPKNHFIFYNRMEVCIVNLFVC